MQDPRHFLKTGFSVVAAGLAGAAVLVHARESVAEEAPPDHRYGDGLAVPEGGQERAGDLRRLEARGY
jgi:hypothetical protein